MNLRLHPCSVTPAVGPEKCGPRRPTRAGPSCNNAKLTHQVLLELPSGKRRVLRVANTKTEIDRFVATLRALKHPREVAFEPTGDYHRPLVYVLGQAGFRLCMVSSIAVARTREALYS